MLDRFVRAFRRINRPPPPEDSIALRVAILLVSLLGCLAAVSQDVVYGVAAVAGFVIIPVGHYFSWRRRRADNWWVKMILTVTLIVAFVEFIRSILRTGFASVADTQEPLAALLVWVLAMHSFDMPGRRDLYFALAASAPLVAVGAVATIADDYGLYVAGFAALGTATLWIGHRCELRELATAGATFDADTPPPTLLRRGVPVVASLLRTILLLSLIGLLIFLAMPRFRAVKVMDLPFSIEARRDVAGGGESVSNPGIEESAGSGGTQVKGGYFGFANRMDLAARSRPDPMVVMRVRSDRQALWRGMAYSRYEGDGWAADDSPPRRITGQSPFFTPLQEGDAESLKYFRSEQLVQTFYLEAAQPNLIFGAQRAAQIYFPSSVLNMDENGTVKSPIEIDAGTVYSVISARPTYTEEDLSEWPEMPSQLKTETVARYLELPPTLPERVRQLAQEIAGDRTGTFARVQAVEEWLKENTEYTLDVPPLRPGADAADQFLFEDRIGYCEQIATAEVVLLRSLGVPARLVAGYTSGRRGILSGLYEVRGDNAHAWTEVYYPGLGWVEHDPTQVVPRAGETPSRAADVFEWIGRQISALPAWVRAPFGAVARFFAAVGRLSPLHVGLLAFAIVAVVLVFRWSKQRRARRIEEARPWSTRLLGKIERAALPLGHRRKESETIKEFSDGLRKGPLLGSDEGEVLKELAALLSRDAFAEHPLEDDARNLAETEAERVTAALERQASGL